MKIFHVIPDEWGPYVDIRACYQSHCERAAYRYVITPKQFERFIGAGDANSIYNDPKAVFVLWTLLDPSPRRRSTVLQVYCEALGGTGMLKPHVDHWDRFVAMKDTYDGVLAHTPMMARRIEQLTQVPTFTFPVGWDAAAMGHARLGSPAHRGYVFQGSKVGRRETLLPALQDALGDNLCDASGTYGRALLGLLDTSWASLYVAHSDVTSYSTWRLWQTASTTAATVTEPGDTWPFRPTEHYCEIPRVTVENSAEVADRLRWFIGTREGQTLLRGVAHAAHEVARQYTIERIDRDFLLPAIEATWRLT